MAEVNLWVRERGFFLPVTDLRPVLELDGRWRWNWSLRQWVSLWIPGDG